MTTKDPLALADALDKNADLDSAEGGNPAVCKLEWDAAKALRTQHAAIERKDALLRRALEALLPEASAHTTETKQKLAVSAIQRELLR